MVQNLVKFSRPMTLMGGDVEWYLVLILVVTLVFLMMLGDGTKSRNIPLCPEF